MNDLPTELLFHIFSFSEHKKSLRCVNRKFANIVDRIIFHTPVFKKRLSVYELAHLPIKVLKVSQISSYDHVGVRINPVNHLPLDLTYFILDSPFTEIDPSVVIAHPKTTFFISIYYLNNCRYHKSHFLQPNVKLYTTRTCFMNWEILRTYKGFTFATLTTSHIGTWLGNKPDILGILAGLKIERLILDKLRENIDPITLLKFENVIHFSSQIFEKGKIFPLHLVNKLPKLESFHCKRKTILNIDEFNKLEKKTVDFLLYYWCSQATSNWAWTDDTLSRIFYEDNKNTYCRYDTLIHLKKAPEHLLTLQPVLL